MILKRDEVIRRLKAGEALRTYYIYQPTIGLDTVRRATVQWLLRNNLVASYGDLFFQVWKWNPKA